MNENAPVARAFAGGFNGWRRLALCLVALLVATAASARSSYSSIVVFGDSLSDTGRLYHLTNGGFPPSIAYFEGRQSNGPVWVEYLAFRLGLEHRLRDYAVIGAMTAPTSAIPTGNVWSDTFGGLDGTSLSGQVAQYLASTGGKVDPDALYIVEGGANDLIGPLSMLLASPPSGQAEFMQDVQEIITPTVVNVATITGTLKALGARHIAVVNVPDFGKAPRLVGYGPVASAVVSQVVDLLNQYVDGQLNLIDAAGGSQVLRIDAYGFIDGVVAAPDSFGFTDVQDAFMQLDLSTKTVTFASPHRYLAWKYFFWDDLHPTTRGHEYFAEFALATVCPVEHCHR